MTNYEKTDGKKKLKNDTSFYFINKSFRKLKLLEKKLMKFEKKN